MKKNCFLSLAFVLALLLTHFNAAGTWYVGLAIDTAGNVYVADQDANVIWKISTSGTTRFAGNDTAGFSGDGGPAVLAKIYIGGYNYYMNTDLAGNLYISDNGRLRKIDQSSGTISTIAGTGTAGYSGDGGPATSAEISISGIAVDTSGNIYISSGNFIRKITAATGIISTIAGTGSPGFSVDGGPATSATMRGPGSIAVNSSGNIYIADCGNSRVRKINTAGTITTIAGNGDSARYYGDGGAATLAPLTSLSNLNVDDSGNVYVCNGPASDSDFACVRRVDATSGLIHFVNEIPAAAAWWGPPIVSRNGSAYCLETSVISTYAAAPSNISTWSVSDSTRPASYRLNDSLSLAIMGTITGTPSSSDSATITVDYGDGTYQNSVRTYRLPYINVAGTYTFGSLYNNIGRYTYVHPGIYTPFVKITTLSGYHDFWYLPADTALAVAGSSITGISFSGNDYITSGPCVFPVIDTIILNGTVSGTPSASDSAYIYISYLDGSGDEHVVPYTSTGTGYIFTYTGSHAYAAGLHDRWPTVYVTTPSGLSSYSHDLPYITIPDLCSGGTLSVTTPPFDLTGAGTGCSLPFTDSINAGGENQLSDSATTATFVRRHIYYGDGADTFYNMPVTTDGRGHYYYLASAGPTAYHVYTMPGFYSAYYIDSANTYSSSGYVTYSGSGLSLGTSCSPLSGLFYIDANHNCLHDSGEVALSYWPFQVINHTYGTTACYWCNDTGGYAINIDSGCVYTIVANPGSYGTGVTITPSCPVSGLDTITATGASFIANFAFAGDTASSFTPTMDMSVAGWGWGFVPGDTGIIGLWASGPWGFTTDTLSSTVTLIKDARLRYMGMWTGPSPSTVSGDTLTWNFSTITDMLNFDGYVKVFTDTTATSHDTIRNQLYVAPTRLTDPDLSNNTYAWQQPVTASWDPNEKQVSQQGYGAQGYITNNTPLSYIIHFQNTGSAPSRNITIFDTLSSYLDITTLQVIASSSPVLLFADSNFARFRFNDINLPDSAVDPIGSIGFIAYNIVPRDSLVPGTQIRNKACIFFDYNPGVFTGVTINTIEDTVGDIYGGDTICIGSSLRLSNHISGGVWSASNGHASINDSGVVVGLTSGTDTITYTVYDNEAAQKIIYVNDSVASAGVITGSSLSLCEGDSVNFTATMAGGSWSSSNPTIATISHTGVVSGVSGGHALISYTVTNRCGSSNDTTGITVNAVPAIAPITGTTSTTVGGTTTLFDVTTGGVWSSSNPTIATINAGGIVIGVALGTVTVTYTVTNAFGCTADTTVLITVRTAAGIGTLNGDRNYSIFPNPATGEITITWQNQQSGKGAIQLYDVTGRLVRQQTFIMDAANGSLKLNLFQLPAGAYFVKITSETGCYNGKLIIE